MLAAPLLYRGPNDYTHRKTRSNSTPAGFSYPGDGFGAIGSKARRIASRIDRERMRRDEAGHYPDPTRVSGGASRFAHGARRSGQGRISSPGRAVRRGALRGPDNARGFRVHEFRLL